MNGEVPVHKVYCRRTSSQASSQSASPEPNTNCPIATPPTPLMAEDAADIDVGDIVDSVGVPPRPPMKKIIEF